MGAPNTTATDVASLETALVSAINGLAPSYQRDQASGWWHVTGRNPPTSLRLRQYDIEWGVAAPFDGGLTGQANLEVEIDCSIITDYRLFPEELLGQIVHEDGEDLQDLIENRWNGQAAKITGLTFSDYLGFTEVQREGSQRISFDFQLRYMRARRSH